MQEHQCSFREFDQHLPQMPQATVLDGLAEGFETVLQTDAGWLAACTQCSHMFTAQLPGMHMYC